MQFRGNPWKTFSQETEPEKGHHETIADTLLGRTSHHEDAGKNIPRLLAFANGTFTTKILCFLQSNFLKEVKQLKRLSRNTVNMMENIPGNL